MRDFVFWFLTRIPAVALWIVGMGALAVAVRVVELAYRIRPHGAPPNCWIYAAHAWTTALREGREPYWVIRFSRLRPRWIPHAMICKERDHDTGSMPLESFVPVGADDVDVAWWQIHRWTVFRGRVVTEETRPSPLGD